MLTYAFGLQIVSTMGTTTLEDVAAASGDASRHMFQLYVIKDRDFTQKLVQVRNPSPENSSQC